MKTFVQFINEKTTPDKVTVEIDCVVDTGSIKDGQAELRADLKRYGLKASFRKAPVPGVSYVALVSGPRNIVKKWLKQNEYEYEASKI